MRKTVAVTGASGFVGRHVVRFLQGLDGFRVVASGRDEEKLSRLGCDYVIHDLAGPADGCFQRFGHPDFLIHLAWEGLPNYQELFHIERNLEENYRFLKAMVQQGLQDLTVAGTCYEYGLQSGCLAEDAPTQPVTGYGLGKETLCRFLETLSRRHPFRMKWARLFYMYGEGQNPKALIPLLDRALEERAEFFEMSGGEQLRDYLAAEEAAALLAKVALQGRHTGIVNICSGTPVSIRRLVEERIAEKGGTIRLKLGAFPYPAHEPMACWGNDTRLRECEKSFQEEHVHE